MVDDHAAVLRAVEAASADLTALINDIVPRMRQGGRIVYLGAGTSGRLGVLDASECPPTFQSDPQQVVGIIAGGDAALRRSSESREDDPNGARDELDALQLTDADTVIGIAAGGTTPYVRGAFAIAADSGAHTAFLTCSPETEAPSKCERLIALDTGPELLTGSTRLKAGTATKLALNIITTISFVRLGKVYTNLMVDLSASNDKLRDRAIRILVHFFPDLSRDNAATLLDHADGHVKVAIAMHRLGVDRADAKQRLTAASGSLRALLDAHSPATR